MNARIDEMINRIYNHGCWCVWMRCSDGGYARITRFWTRRGARDFINRVGQGKDLRIGRYYGRPPW